MFDTIVKKIGYPICIVIGFIAGVIVLSFFLKASTPIKEDKPDVVKESAERIPHLKGGETRLNNEPKVPELQVAHGKPPLGSGTRWSGAKYFEAKPSKIDAAKGNTATDANLRYAVSGTMMWDADNLYVGAIIGDPHKRIAVNTATITDPDEDVPSARKGSSIEIGIFNRNQALLPKAEFKFQDQDVTVTKSGIDDEEKVVNKFLALTFCKLDENEKVCLIVRKIQDKPAATKAILKTRIYLQDGVEGFKGSFTYPKKDDKKCYFEAAIPWKILTGDNSSLPYSSFKTSWIVRWVDAGQPDRFGTLIEVVAPGSTFADPTKWADTSKWGIARLDPAPSK